MSEAFVLEAQSRNDAGKGSSRRLRRLENKVPAVVYGGTADPVSISLDTIPFGINCKMKRSSRTSLL